jgi:flagellar L-ring protein precursor FlgH
LTKAPTLMCLIVLVASLSGCSAPPDFMRPPALSAVGSGVQGTADDLDETAESLSALPRSPAPSLKAADLYSDQRVAKIGDIVTVVISINDKATFGNETDRSTSAKTAFSMDFGFTPPSSGSSSSGGSPGTMKTDVSSTSNATGQGDINRSEQIQVSVPAIVTRVLPNGNLLIRGSQEVRVNFEMRQVTVAGVVNPSDVSRANTIAYDRVAEARVSYGGRGRLSEVQQPSWGHQIYDYARPF